MVATIHLINAIVLLGLGAWIASGASSLTAWIPVGCGMILGYLYPGVKKQSKIVSHIAVTLTLVVLIALILKPLQAALSATNSNNILLICIIIMIFTSAAAVIAFIASFIQIRIKKRAEKEG